MVPLRDFMAKFDGAFWKEITEKLQDKIKSFEWARSVEKLPGLTDTQLKMILAQEEALKAVISLPSEIKAVLEKMEAEHRMTLENTGALEKNAL